MAQALKTLAIAVTSAFIGACIAGYVNEQKIDASAQQLRERVAKLDEELAQLQQNNTQLHLLLGSKDFNPLTNSKTSSAVQSLNPTQTTEAQPLPIKKSTESAASTQLQDEQLLLKSESFGKWLANTLKEKGSFNLQAEMQHRFEAETVNHEWAEAQEQEYLTLFDNSPELAGLALRETQCRSQQCALTVSISDINQANTLLEKMTATLKQQNKYPIIIATPDEQRGVTTLYIGKDANSFEFN